MASNYKQISATTQIKTSATVLSGLFISAASATPTITVYDSANANTSDPKVLDTFTPTAGTNYFFDGGVYAGKGLYIVLGGTVSATILFE